MVQKLKMLFLYDGLKSREDYKSIVGDIKAQNRKGIVFYSILVCIVFAILFAGSFFVENLIANRYAYLGSAVLSLCVSLGMYFFGKKSLVINTIFTYIFSTMMLGFDIIIGTVNEPDTPAIAFCVLIVILPLITYDFSVHSLVYRVFMSAIYIILAFKYKSSDIVWTDIVDICCYGFIGAVVGVMNQRIKTRSYFLSRNMNKEIEIKTEQIENITLETISAMSDTLEAKDEYTRGHSNRVSEYSALIAKKMNLPEDSISEIRYAASLHDIGKIGVPDSILNKPGKLTDEEYSVIKKHSTIGSEILRKMNMIAYTSDIARHHHERYDGKGYPDGLKGSEISIGARIVAVADSYDAMSSKRVYRAPLDRDKIISEIERNKGIQFDPDVADAFLELLKTGEIDAYTI